MNHSWDMAHSLYSSYVFLAAPTPVWARHHELIQSLKQAHVYVYANIIGECPVVLLQTLPASLFFNKFWMK